MPFLHYFTSSRAFGQDNHLHPFFIHQLKYSVYILVRMYDDAKKGMFEILLVHNVDDEGKIITFESHF